MSIFDKIRNTAQIAQATGLSGERIRQICIEDGLIEKGLAHRIDKKNVIWHVDVIDYIKNRPDRRGGDRRSSAARCETA